MITIEKKPRKKKSVQDMFVLAKYSNIGYYVMTPMLMGVIVGLGIDYYLNSKPTFTLICIFFGFGFTMYNLYKLTKDQF